MGLTVARPAWGATEELIAAGATWSYNDLGNNLGTSWQDPAYDDSSWPSGPAELGYGDGDETTVIGFGLDPNNKFVTYYFRHTFTVTDPAAYTTLNLEVLKDDGAVVYLNGAEIARYNLPSGTIAYSTYASTASDYSWEAAAALTPGLLVAGDNVIAVEVHQGNATSSDVSFDLRLTATKEISVTLDSPAADATGVALPAVLTATVTDPEGQSLKVDFFGRPAPPPEPDFTIVVLPDTQFYTDEINGGRNEMFISQTDWIVANRESRNIVYVAHLGDVSNNGDLDENEWIRAADALYRLENPVTTMLAEGIPYGAAVGNHDQYNATADGDPSATTYYNDYFGVPHFQGRSYYGGQYGTNNNNHYDLFSAGGLDFIVVYFEYNAYAPALLSWADSLLKAYPDRRAIVVTHYFLNLDGSFGTQGAAIYNALKDNPNLFLMLCGHNHGENRRGDVYDGNTVHTLLSDYQSRPNGGDGLLRIMEFSPDNNQVRVQTYSPWLGQYETDADSEFTLDYDMITGPAFELVQENTGVASGSQTSAVWTGLEPGTEYLWLATATDAVETKTSEIRRFTTSANTPPTVSISSPEDGTVFSPAPADVVITAAAGDADGNVISVEFWVGTTFLADLASEPFETTVSLGEGYFELSAVAYDNQGGSTVSAPVHITVGGAPTAPTELVAAALSSSEIGLTWTDNSSNETGFEVHQSTNGGPFELVATVAPDTTGVTVSGLAPSTPYTYFVRAFNGAGSADSAPASDTTDAPPPVPGAPTDLTAVPWSDSEVRLTWSDNSTDEIGFRIEGSPDGASWASLGTVGADIVSSTDAGLTSGLVRYYRVWAYNQAGDSNQPSNPAAAAPYVYSLANSETLVAGSQTGTYVDTQVDDDDYEQLTEEQSGGKPASRRSLLEHKWTFDVTPGSSVTFLALAHQLPAGNEDRFAFAWSMDDAAYASMVGVTPGTEPGTLLTYDLPGDSSGTVYIQVTDTDRSAGNSALDTLIVDFLMIRTEVDTGTGSGGNPPPAPTLVAANAGDGVVNLTWSPSAGATSYTVWRRQGGGGSYAVIAEQITGTTYGDGDVTNGTTYDYQITAVNGDGESGASNVLSATPQAAGMATEPPSNLSAASAKKKTNLSWSQSPTPGILQNKIYRADDGVNFQVVETIFAGTTYSDALPSGATCAYYVTAVGAAGESAPSNEVTGTAK